ncbi:ABC-2 type transport system permease protein [Seinonella peptonophila]|uniref:ABC-2 type transport system permease protein n=1 Tax=Seinonella peptonophila TaxID=112248 RepID=A0A1M4X3F6_9BACL|nr:ABC transporter permease [Seinonella peptonophila]SHE88064.1 ABC-2 type transport system permease protein [Seinonella peptonophila]
MKDFIWLTKHFFSLILKKPKTLLLYLGTPLVSIGIAFLLFGSMGTESVHVGIINDDHQKLATETIQFIQGLKQMNVKQIQQKDVSNQLASGNLDLVIRFQPGFTKGLYSGKPNQVEVISIKGAAVTTQVESYLNHHLDQLSKMGQAANGDIKMFEQIYQGTKKGSLQVVTHSTQDESINDQISTGSIGYLLVIMLISAANLSGTILQEKENRTYFRLLSTPINARKFVLANVCVNMSIMIIQAIITILLMTKVFNIQTHIPVWGLALVMILYSFVAVAISLVMISFSNSSSTASTLQNIIITPTCMLAGCFWPVEIMPNFVQRIADFLPQHWTLETLKQLQLGESISQLSLHLAIICAFAAAFFLIAIYKFSRNDDVRTFL